MFLGQVRIPFLCHSCAVFGGGPVDDLELSGLSSLGVCYDPGTVFPCCFFPNLRAPLVAQMAKNLSAMPETWVRSLGWEDPLEEGMATHFSILAWRIPMDRGAWGATVHGGVAQSQTRPSN